MNKTEQLNWINEHSNDIMDFCENSGIILKHNFKIPLNFKEYSSLVKEVQKKRLRALNQEEDEEEHDKFLFLSSLRKLLREAFSDTEDYYIINLHYAYRSVQFFTLEESIPSYKYSKSSDNLIKYKVYATDTKDGTVKFRTVHSVTEESAIKNALYSLSYDNKREFKFSWIETVK